MYIELEIDDSKLYETITLMPKVKAKVKTKNKFLTSK